VGRLGAVKASRADVARLFGRAAFGATAADLDKWTGRPYADVVSFLLDIPSPDARAPAGDDVQRLFYDKVDFGGADIGTLQQAQAWWLDRMHTTAYPLEERMTLFWHDHFATGINDKGTGVGAMVAQNQTIRKNALGNFRTFCAQITLDPAMLFWLDGAFNSGFAPNENYAREFFELFTLGTIPQVYTEHDIRQSARALSGWTCDAFTRLPRFDAGNHAAGQKVVLHRTITDQGDKEYLEIVDVALAQRVAPLFIAYKLALNFAYVPETTNLLKSPGPLIGKIARALRRTNWNLREAVRTMLLADEFRYADESRGRQVVRQPIELVVHACKALGMSSNNANAIAMLERMGQVPFKPPNVGGWPFGKDWLSPATFLARYDWGILAYQLYKKGVIKDALPASGDLKTWTAKFGLAAVSKNTQTAIQSYLHSRKGAPEAELQTGVLALIVSSPDWMVM
jgi:uncharacterized protein (DUF1800 family)